MIRNIVLEGRGGGGGRFGPLEYRRWYSPAALLIDHSSTFVAIAIAASSAAAGNPLVLFTEDSTATMSVCYCCYSWPGCCGCISRSTVLTRRTSTFVHSLLSDIAVDAAATITSPTGGNPLVLFLDGTTATTATRPWRCYYICTCGCTAVAVVPRATTFVASSFWVGGNGGRGGRQRRARMTIPFAWSSSFLWMLFLLLFLLLLLLIGWLRLILFRFRLILFYLPFLLL